MSEEEVEEVSDESEDDDGGEGREAAAASASLLQLKTEALERFARMHLLDAQLCGIQTVDLTGAQIAAAPEQAIDALCLACERAVAEIFSTQSGMLRSEGKNL